MVLVNQKGRDLTESYVYPFVFEIRGLFRRDRDRSRVIPFRKPLRTMIRRSGADEGVEDGVEDWRPSR